MAVRRQSPDLFNATLQGPAEPEDSTVLQDHAIGQVPVAPQECSVSQEHTVQDCVALGDTAGIHTVTATEAEATIITDEECSTIFLQSLPISASHSSLP